MQVFIKKTLKNTHNIYFGDIKISKISCIFYFLARNLPIPNTAVDDEQPIWEDVATYLNLTIKFIYYVTNYQKAKCQLAANNFQRFFQRWMVPYAYCKRSCNQCQVVF